MIDEELARALVWARPAADPLRDADAAAGADTAGACAGAGAGAGAVIVEARLRFPKDLSLFAGHFPGYPIVPGAILLEAVRLAAARAIGAPLALAAVAQAKFTGEVRPDQDVEVRMTLTSGVRLAPAQGALLAASVELFAAVGPVARLRLTLAPRE